MNNSTNNSTRRIPVKGKIIDRKDKKPGREIIIEKTESRKLPINDYPLTHKRKPEGLEVEVIAVSSQGKCQASFHRYPEKSRYGEGAHIFTATRRLHDNSQSDLFRNFLQHAGVFTPGTQVNLDFEKRGEVIKVYLF